MTNDFDEIINNEPTPPNDAGEYAEGLTQVLKRIPDRYWKVIECGRGWYQIIVELDNRLSRLCPNYEVYQVKEKFGGLRYYWGCSGKVAPEVYQEMLDITRSYENLSKTACEDTGEPGVLMISNNYILKTLNPETAPKHYEIYYKESAASN